ncbi:hypothetical protein P0Y67_22670, partial [Photobacterium sp. SP02]|uniref:hypothetical protein n=1 Tax=Photobacterium sp. SP02 TaxID=3032280 RepID=UPI0031451133
PASTREPKGISGYALCQQRVTGAHPAVLRKTPNLSATYDQQKLMFFIKWFVDQHLASVIFCVDT